MIYELYISIFLQPESRRFYDSKEKAMNAAVSEASNGWQPIEQNKLYIAAWKKGLKEMIVMEHEVQ